MLIFHIVAGELESLTVDSPEKSTEDNINIFETEDHLDNKDSKKEADEHGAESESLEMKNGIVEKDVETEDTCNSNTDAHTMLKSEINTLTRENVEYKVEIEALKYEVAKLKEELSQ